MWNPFAFPVRRGLRYLVLSSLSRSPKNGAEIIDEIDNLTRGWWRPSPGSVYPLLETLSKDGLIRKREDGRYELTESGRKELEPFGFLSRTRPGSVEDIIQELSSYVSYLEDLSKKEKDSLNKNKEKLKEIIGRLQNLASG